MRGRVPPILSLLMALLLLAHVVRAMQQWRWVTALVEAAAAILLLLVWWTDRSIARDVRASTGTP